MKKLRVFLLAIVFVFGLAVQASAGVTTNIGKDAFTEDVIITFNDYDVDLSRDIPITTQYKTEAYGVEFLEGCYLEDFYSQYWGVPYAAGNLNLNTFSTTQTAIRMNFTNRVTRVGFDAVTPFQEEYPITVIVYRDDLVVYNFDHYLDWDSNAYTSLNPFISIEDTEGIDAIEIIGNGFFYGWDNLVVIDNLQFGGTPDAGLKEIPVTEVKMNVKPPNCLGASINMKSQGVTPVVIAGSKDFDVTTIDSSSVRLNGLAPVRTSIEDVPLCGSTKPDGFLDLTLKFHTPDLVRAMEDFLQEGETLENDDMVVLELSGNLLEEWGGAPIEGEDTVTVLDTLKDKKGKDKKNKKHKHKHKKLRTRHGWIR